MRPEQRFPKIFANYRNGMPNRGWQRIIEHGCAQIQEYCDEHPEVEQVVAQQVKEKFGSLRFYATGGDANTRIFIGVMEDLCDVTCEFCGAPGTASNAATGWIKTTCPKHANTWRKFTENSEMR